MKECTWTEQVAFYAGDDLEDSSVPELEQHLQECEPCRQLLTELRRDREALQHPPILSDDIYIPVRAAVLARLAERRSRWPWAVAASFILAVAGVGIWFSSAGLSSATPPPVVVAIKLPTPAVAVLPSREPTPAVAIRRKKMPRTRPAIERTYDLMAEVSDLLTPGANPQTGSESPVLITMSTSNPDVAIVLVEEMKGKANE